MEIPRPKKMGTEDEGFDAAEEELVVALAAVAELVALAIDDAGVVACEAAVALKAF